MSNTDNHIGDLIVDILEQMLERFGSVEAAQAALEAYMAGQR